MIDNANTKSEAAKLIESITAERDALAEQVRLMREALEAAALQVPEVLDYLGPRGHSDVQQNTNPTSNLISSALALAPTAAEVQAKENAEKAALIESLESDRDALAEQVRVMREKFTALLESIGASMDCTFDGSIDEAEHSADCLGCELSNICNKALALAPNAAEQRAKENAEAAAQVPGLVEQLRVMREALEFIDATEHEYPIEYEMDTGAELAATYAWGNAIIECRDAMTLTPTAAETQAKANAEKAAEYDATRAVMSGLFADKPLQDAVAMRISELVFGLDLSSPSGEKVRQYESTRDLLAGNFAEFPLDVAVSHWYMDTVRRAESAEAKLRAMGVIDAN